LELGIHVNRFTWPDGPGGIATRLSSIVQRAEEAGFSTLSVMDHFFQISINGPPDLDMLEGYTTLGYIAAKTSKIRLGTVVTGVTYRHPGLLVKQLTTLDVLSGGRAYFGVGAAWFEQEHRGLGVPFPPLKERFERLEETLQIAHHMWSGNAGPYEGKYYQLANPMLFPPAIQKPHPMIVVGGEGEQKTLKLVAKYGDACNLHDTPELAHKLEVLRGHCEDAGRPYDAITKGVQTKLAVSLDGRDGTSTPAAIVDHYGELRELGITWVNVSIPDMAEPGSLELIGSRIVPEIAKL
jgi:F420-dependent oxidoreductase-like protein